MKTKKEILIVAMEVELEYGAEADRSRMLRRMQTEDGLNMYGWSAQGGKYSVRTIPNTVSIVMVESPNAERKPSKVASKAKAKVRTAERKRDAA